MKETPYTDALITNIINDTLDSKALECNLDMARIEAISNSVIMILRKYVKEHLEAHCPEIMDELSITGELNPAEIERAVANKISKQVKDNIKQELDYKYQFVSSIYESNDKPAVKPTKLTLMYD